MAELRDIASKKTCGGGANAANTGKLGCLSIFGTPAHMLGFPKGTVFPANTDFNLEYLKELVKAGKATPIIGASTFEDVSSEDGYYSNSRGAKRLNLKGLPEYKLIFEEGHGFYKELAKMESYKSYDYMIGDEEGNWLIGTKSNGDYIPFSAGHTTPELTKRAVIAGDPEMKSFVVQFLDRLQWDKNYDILHAEDLDFTPAEIPAVNGTVIKYVNLPSNGDTTILLDVYLHSDRHSGVEGLEVGNLAVTYNGATQVIGGVVENSAGRYTLTVPAVVTGQTIVVTHFNGDSNTTVADSNDILYRAAVVASAVAG